MSDDTNRPPEPPKNDRESGESSVRRNAVLEPVQRGHTPPTPPPASPFPAPEADAYELRTLRSARNFTLAASIIGPVSLFIGGVLLSIVGVVCGFLGFKKVKALAATNTSIGMAALTTKRSCIIALVFCGIAAVLNAIAFAYMFPIALEAVQTGDYSALGGGPAATPPTDSSSSAW